MGAGGLEFSVSPVPKCEGPGAPSSWFEQFAETGAIALFDPIFGLCKDRRSSSQNSLATPEILRQSWLA